MKFFWIAMYKLSCLALGLVACAGIATSCTKEDYFEDSVEVKETYFSLSQGESEVGSRVIIDTEAKVRFSAADVVNYYTGKGSTVRGGLDKKYTIPTDPGANNSISFPVTYTDGDNNVVFLLKGTSIGDYIGTPDFSTLKLTDGVPATQDGAFSSTHIAVAKASLTSNAATMTALQGYIKFKMSSLIFHDTEVNKIVITATGNTGAGDTGICGDITITNPGSSATVAYGTGTSVTIDKSTSKFIVNQEYYVALNATTYTNGLTFTMYNRNAGTDTELGKVLVKLGSSSGKQLVVTKGKVLNIGDIQTHKSVNISSVTLYPTLAATTWKRGKKFWLRILPEDYTGEIKVTVRGVDNLLTVVEDGTETLEGVGLCRRYKGTVTNSSYQNYAERKCTVTFTLPAADGYTAASKECSCVVELGEFYEMGLKNKAGKRCLWARGYLQGAGPTKETFSLGEEGELGTFYVWGKPYEYWFDAPLGSHATSEASTHNNWDKSAYRGTPRLTVLRDIDDACYVWDNRCHTPSIYDAGQLLANTTYASKIYTCTIPGYQDMYIKVNYGLAYNWGTNSSRYASEGFILNEYMMEDVERFRMVSGINFSKNVFDRAFARYPVMYK